MVNQSEQIFFHRCGRVIIQDPDGAFKVCVCGSPEIGGIVWESVLTCPTCGALLRERDLYHTQADIAREKLRDAGWYPDPDSLALMDDPQRRAAILCALKQALEALGDADLLSVYAVVMTLGSDRE